MKNLLCVSLLLLVALSCGADKEIKPVVFDTYKGYFAKNDAAVGSELFYFISPKLSEFEKYFSSAATLSKQKWIDGNSLGNQLIIAVANKTDNDTEKLEIQSIKKQGSVLYVDYKIEKLDQAVSHVARHCAVTVAAARKIKKAVFSESGKEVAQIELK